MMNLGPTPISVSEVVGQLKELIEGSFSQVFIQGEVTNLSYSSAGHWYFSLSDENATISCALFKADAFRNPLIKKIKDGDQVVLFGPVSIYAKRGSMQLLVKKIVPAGEGLQKLKLELLKQKLIQEGLFDPARKKIIPKYPQKIAVITAKGGAALQDFLNVIKRRSLWYDVIIIPAIMQGEQAPISIIEALKKVQKLQDVEVCVITRGGGSAEDLSAFNDELLVREVAASHLPVISAIGHQIDFSLVDYVADLRVETPTAAAEVLTQSQTELRSKLLQNKKSIQGMLFFVLNKIHTIKEKYRPQELLLLYKHRIEMYRNRLQASNLVKRADQLIPLHQFHYELDEHAKKMQYLINVKMMNHQAKMSEIEQLLHAFDPKSILKRGYTYIEDTKGEVVKSSKTIKDKFKIHFHDGVVSVEAKEIK